METRSLWTALRTSQAHAKPYMDFTSRLAPGGVMDDARHSEQQDCIRHLFAVLTARLEDTAEHAAQGQARMVPATKPRTSPRRSMTSPPRPQPLPRPSNCFASRHNSGCRGHFRRYAIGQPVIEGRRNRCAALYDCFQSSTKIVFCRVLLV